MEGLLSGAAQVGATSVPLGDVLLYTLFPVIAMIVGGAVGSLVGAGLFRVLQNSGQIDLVIGFLYVILLGSIGVLMLKDALVALGWVELGEREERPRHNRWIASLPLRWRFYASGLYLSPLAPLVLGFVAGIMTVLLGVGGGFILVPAMIYLFGMAARVVVGTSLVMILAVSAVTTIGTSQSRIANRKLAAPSHQRPAPRGAGSASPCQPPRQRISA